MKFYVKGATLTLTQISRHAYILSNLYSMKRNCGEAGLVMEAALEYADTNNAEVMLWAQQFGDIHGLKTEELVSWYERLGFVKVKEIHGRVMMIRPPSQKKHGL